MDALDAVQTYERRTGSTLVLLEIVRGAARDWEGGGNADAWLEEQVPGEVYPALPYPNVPRSAAVLLTLLDELEEAGSELVQRFRTDR
jgi:hypothetical protein